MRVIESLKNLFKKPIPIESIETRHSLMYAMIELSDQDFHRNHWVNSEHAHSYWDNLTRLTSFIMDDLWCKHDPKGQLGYTLFDEEEIDAIESLMESVESIVYNLGENKPDEEYYESHLCDYMTDCARHAYGVMLRNDKRYGLDKKHPDFLRRCMENN